MNFKKRQTVNQTSCDPHAKKYRIKRISYLRLLIRWVIDAFIGNQLYCHCYVTVQTNTKFDMSKRFIRYFLFHIFKDFLLR